MAQENKAEKETYQTKYSMHFDAGSNPMIFYDANFNIDKIDLHAGGLYSSIMENVKAKTQTGESVPTDGKAQVVDINDKENRVRRAYEAVEQEGLLKHKGDVAYIKKAMEEKPIEMVFNTDRFLAYMGGLHIDGLPSKSTLNRQTGRIGRKGCDGYYQFLDNCDRNEMIRRNNIMKMFLSEYIRGAADPSGEKRC